jgi:phospholipid/cholesterol/gamma-HCH transport system substrate-binding protein
MRETWISRLVVGLLVLGLATYFLPRLLGDETIELTATYDEVGDLVENADVRFGDVPVGTIGEIRLTDDHRAEVTLRLDAEERLPERAIAVLRMTAVLGERYVDLVPDPEEGAPVDEGAALPGIFEQDIELVVEAGSELLGALSADRIAHVIEVGHRTFDGRGERLGELVDEVGDYVGQLEAGRGELARFLDASERLTSTLAPDAELHAGALEDLADLAEMLAEEEERLIGALDELAGTAEVGSRIVADNRQSLDGLLARLSRFSGEVLRVDRALENLLLWLPRHNLHVPGGIRAEHSQVLNDFSICGIHDEDDNPANACDPPNPGRPNQPHPRHVIDECILYHVGCEGYPDGVHPYRAHTEEQRTTPEERRRKVEQAEGSVEYRLEPREPAPEGLR